MFETHLRRWNLEPDGAPIVTPRGHLLPVRWRGQAAMLKVATDPEERAGAALLAWWAGGGAAAVFALAGDAVLIERAEGSVTLAAMAAGGQDDAASRILCAAAARLHAHSGLPPSLVPLGRWFRELAPAGSAHGGVLARAASVAGQLLAAPEPAMPLHGDLYHDNVLDFGPRGWLAIDPKGLLGERGFEFVALLRNPDAAIATAPGRLARQVAVVSAATGLAQHRLLRWVMAGAALSATWSLSSGDDPSGDLIVAAQAEALLRA